MHAILSYRGNGHPNTHSKHTHTHPQTDGTHYNTLRCS